MSLFGGTAQLNYDRQDGAPITPSYVVIGLDGTLTNERVLTGTTNQVTITDNAAGGTVVVSLPQDIHAGASPSFTGLTLSGLTAGRVMVTSTGGQVTDDSGLLWDATNNKLSLNNGISWSGSSPSVIEINRTLTTPPNTPPGAVNPLVGIFGTFAQSGGVNQGRIGLYASVGDDASVVNRTITGVGVGAGSTVRITSVGHGFATGDRINIYGITGTVSSAAHGVWTITRIDADNFDLQGSTHSGSYTSGGTATNRGLYYAATFNVRPALDRTGSTLVGTGTNGDDVAAITISNDGAGTATDAIWITDASISGGTKPAFHSLFASDADVDVVMSYFGKIYSVGINLASATLNASSVPMVRLGAGHNIELDTATGTKLGTSTSQKLGFFNATPVVQNTSTTDLRTGLINLGFFASGGASPLNLNGGALTAATGTFSTGTITSSGPAVDISQTWNSGGTTFTGFKQNITNTASASTSLLADFQVGGTTRLSLDVGGALLHRGADAASTVYQWDNHAGGALGTPASLNSTINNFLARHSAGTLSAPIRTQSGQVVLRLSAGGYSAANDSTSATQVAAHKSAVDFVASETWTSSANGMIIRFRTTAAGGTTASVKAMITEQGLDLNAGGTGATARSTTSPTNALNLFNGTVPAGTLTNGVTLYSDTGKLKSADAAGTIGHVLSVSAVNTVSPTAQNRTLTVDIGGTTYYITAKTTND